MGRQYAAERHLSGGQGSRSVESFGGGGGTASGPVEPTKYVRVRPQIATNFSKTDLFRLSMKKIDCYLALALFW